MVASMSSKSDHHLVATAHETIDALVTRSGREAIPVRRTFVQQKEHGKSVPGPFAQFVSSNDRFGLLLYLLLLTCASAPPFDVGLHSAVWARGLAVPDPTSATARTRVSKAWARMAARNLIERGRRHRIATVTPLNEDGSGDAYTRPSTSFMSIDHRIWTEGPSSTQRWYEVLNLAELAALVIAHMNGDDFALPAERVPDYYGISPDTFQRGVSGLKKRELLDDRWSRKAAPLAPEGYTYEHRYTLDPPFGPMGVTSKATGAIR
jgi:hypothetical protein